MKTLYIIRHADSEKLAAKETTDSHDIKRKLSKTGINDAKNLAKKLDEVAQYPDLIISSTAERAIATAKTLAKKMDYPVEKIVTEKIFYDGAAQDRLIYLERLLTGVNSVYVIGHNPGLSELVTTFIDTFTNSIPKCGVVAIEFQTDQWSNLRTCKRWLKFYDFPNGKKDIKRQLAESVSVEIFNDLSTYFSNKSYETQKHMKESMAKAGKGLGKEFVKTLKRKKDKIKKSKTWASKNSENKKDKISEKDK